jgi:hypothetical protein
LVTSGFFINPLTLKFFRDPFQNIDLKLTIAAGLGYDAMRGGDLELSFGLSGGYQETRYVSVQADQADRERSGAIIPQLELDWELTGNIDFFLTYNAQVGVPKVENTFHHARTAVSFDLLGDVLDLEVAVNWDRSENPRPNAEGLVPKRDDVRTSFGIGLDL